MLNTLSIITPTSYYYPNYTIFLPYLQLLLINKKRPYQDIFPVRSYIILVNP
nr:MAG TPA: hypothetical protein [Siphoviridae sp. ct6662]